MPVYAEKIEQYLSTAAEALEKVEKSRQRWNEINNDLGRLRGRLNMIAQEQVKTDPRTGEKTIRQAFEDQEVDDLVFELMRVAREQVLYCMLPMETIKFISFEHAKFQINQSRNKASRNRMRALRDNPELRKLPFKARRKQEEGPEGNSDYNPVLTALDIHNAMLEDLEFFRQRGEKEHPTEGPCDGEPCTKCRRQIKEGIQWENVIEDDGEPEQFGRGTGTEGDAT